MEVLLVVGSLALIGGVTLLGIVALILVVETLRLGFFPDKCWLFHSWRLIRCVGNHRYYLCQRCGKEYRS